MMWLNDWVAKCIECVCRHTRVHVHTHTHTHTHTHIKGLG